MSVRLELSDLPPRIRAQAEAQIAARGQKKATAAPSMATAASIAETAGMPMAEEILLRAYDARD